MFNVTYGCGVHTACMRADANGIRAYKAFIVNDTIRNVWLYDTCGGLYRLV